MEKESNVIVRRALQAWLPASGYRFLVDGKAFAPSFDGAQAGFNATVGEHQLQVRHGWLKSNVFPCTIQPGHTHYLVLRLRPRFYQPALAILLLGLVLKFVRQYLIGTSAGWTLILQNLLLWPSLAYQAYFLFLDSKRFFILEEDPEQAFV